MTQCEYTKPHPGHHWWLDGSTTPVSNYQQCEGMRDTNPPPFGESGRLTHSKQALGEWEIWKMEQEVGTASRPRGKKHLHFLYLRGNWEWVVRPGGSSPLCKTPRCRAVTIKEAKNG